MQLMGAGTGLAGGALDTSGQPQPARAAACVRTTWMGCVILESSLIATRHDVALDAPAWCAYVGFACCL